MTSWSRVRILPGLALLTLCGADLSSVVAAQAGGPSTSVVTPTPQVPPAEPPPASPASPEPAPAPAAVSPPAPTPEPTTPATPAPAPGAPAPPLAAPNRPFDTQEPEVEKGSWGPWAHSYPEPRQHVGFYLRLSMGLGGGAILGDGHAARGVDEVELTGFGIGTSIGIGAAVVPNLIVDVDFFHASFFDPHVEVDGDDRGDSSHVDPRLGVGEDQQLLGFGIGATYYFMPANIYLAGSLGVGRVVFEDSDGERGGSSLGLAGNLLVGKEWWVADDWGIGIAGQLVLLSAEDDLLDDVDAYALNVMFSATYN